MIASLYQRGSNALAIFFTFFKVSGSLSAGLQLSVFSCRWDVSLLTDEYTQEGQGGQGAEPCE